MNENELWKKLDIKGYRARIGTISMPLNDLTEEEVKEILQ